MFETITGVDLGLQEPPSIPPSTTINEKISEEESDKAHEEKLFRHPYDAIDYSEDSIYNYTRAIKSRIAKIKQQYTDPTEQTEKLNEFIGKHLERFMKISEMSLETFYKGVVIHEKQHQVYESNKAKFGSPEYIQKVKDNAALVLAAGIGMSVIVGGVIMERMATMLVSQQIRLSGNPTYEDVATLIFTLVLAGSNLNKVDNEQTVKDIHKNEALAYSAQGKLWRELSETISIDRKTLYSKVFKQVPNYLPSSNII